MATVPYYQTAECKVDRLFDLVQDFILNWTYGKVFRYAGKYTAIFFDDCNEIVINYRSSAYSCKIYAQVQFILFVKNLLDKDYQECPTNISNPDDPDDPEDTYLQICEMFNELKTDLDRLAIEAKADEKNIFGTNLIAYRNNIIPTREEFFAAPKVPVAPVLPDYARIVDSFTAAEW